MNIILKPEIIDHLSKVLNISKSSVRQYISKTKIKYPKVSLNAAAQIFATERGVSVRRFLTTKDKANLPGIETVKPEKIKVKLANLSKKKQISFFKYDTDEPFKKGHIKEVNNAYTCGCYTSVFILCRKIIENLIKDVLENKYKKERELYWDKTRSRYLDFSVVLDNLYKKRVDFSPSNYKAIERLNQLAQPFKKDSNNKTHSWFHLVTGKKEIDDMGVGGIIDLIKKIEKE